MIQLQVLNKILQEHNSSFLTENNLNDDYFSDFKEEFRYIKERIDKYGQTPDIESFLLKFPSFEVLTVNEPYSYLLGQLVEDKNKRFLIKTYNKVREALQKDDIQTALSIFNSASIDNSVSTGVHSIDILSDTSRYDAYIERTEDFKKFYVSTGFTELDSVIGGWDRQEELATISARPGVGKSFVLIKCAIAAAQQGLTVGIYSGEMSENKVGYRVDTLISHISNRDIIHGSSRVLSSYSDYVKNIKSNITGSIKVLTPAMISGPAGVNALRSFIETDKLDILFVDQHSLLEDDRRAKNPVERAANISRDLKNLQVLKKIPIIAVSQQNRSSTENGVGTEHIAQSDRISQDSTIILFLEQKDDVLTMTLAKSRDSVNGKKIKYAIDLDHGVFNFIPEENDVKSGINSEDLKKSFDDPNYGGADAF